MSATITRDEWLAAVRELEPANDQDALTVNELAAMLGIKITATRERLRKLLTEGKAIRTSKLVTDATGRSQSVLAYRLVKPAKKGK